MITLPTRRIFDYCILVALSCLSSCAPLGSTASSKTCVDSSGESVDTRTIFGKWKKVSGYEEPKSPKELELNYDVLIVEMGAILCQTQVINGMQASSLYKASYSHDIDSKSLDMTFLDGETKGSENVSYSFSGACNNTRMTLSHTESGEDPEVFELITKKVNSNDCSVTSE